MKIGIKLMLDPKHLLKDNQRMVVIRLTINRKRTYISLGYKTKPGNWNEKRSEFKKAYDPIKYKEDNSDIHNKYRRAVGAEEKLREQNILFTTENFKNYLFNIEKEQDVYGFFDEIILELEKKEKVGNVIVYKQAKSALQRFVPKKVLLFKELDIRFLNKFEVHLSKTCSGNSISVYMRTLRALYNNAISRGVVKSEYYPFFNNFNRHGYKIGKLETETEKRAIKLEIIRKLFNFKPDSDSNLIDTSNLVKFIILNRGINFADVVYLRWDKIYDDRVNYRRRKNKKLFSIRITQPVQEILNYYEQFQDDLGYVFPIFNSLHETEKQKKTRIQTALKKFHKDIKVIQKIMGIDTDLKITSYTLRHSWATITRNELDYQTSDVSMGFEHGTEKVTQTYLKKDNSKLDKMNDDLVAALETKVN